MTHFIDDPRKWRISKSGFSIKTGWADETKIIAKYPGVTSPLDCKQFQEWMDNAEDICEMHNAALTPNANVPGLAQGPVDVTVGRLTALDEACYGNEAAEKELEQLRVSAVRWDAIETLMMLGDVELKQAEDGGYRIHVEPAENIMATSWDGDTPEQTVDKVVAKLTTPRLNSGACLALSACPLD